MATLPIRGAVITAQPVLILGASPLRRRVVIQNKSASETLWLSSQPDSLDQLSALMLNPSSAMALDFEFTSDAYMFSSGGTAEIAIIENQGLSVFEEALLKAVALLPGGIADYVGGDVQSFMKEFSALPQSERPTPPSITALLTILNTLAI